ncbi:hypothetical protein IPC1147_33125 [Pseudomonas aeruginosa]|uniref:hypothetical protein n=1 Tax=Pseudomonas aeruginosa TaxID=287 RepID=UPI000E677DA6|nr:hypothetical protein [Pseudomonas aeruginosa]MBA5107654.1 hypothetical protein [Pseudomonas aeruginosa]MCO2528452.1 hypothetical protein [Pseudomonas aeruginosa]MCO2541426.1 hypothetical protein [Pseudomonas aeruginosa]MDP5993372.1 hypothetical protein [Pseudomonas aeruginosa]RIY46510.1 hypothetical protein AXW86_32060 [Pseudomonas aeruginosa]
MQKSHKFSDASLQTFPYLQAMSFSSRSELEEFTRQQNQLAVQSRKSFDERLMKLKEEGGSLRTYPTPHQDVLDDCMVDTALLKAMARNLSVNSPTAPASETAPAVAPVAASQVPAELDPSVSFEGMYEGVEIDPEYDNSIAVGPKDELQPVAIDWTNAFVGEITHYGRYPFQFKEENRKKNLSYVIRLGSENIWGVGLEAVMRQHKFKKGDRIALKCIGSDPVTVPEEGRDDQGNEQVILRPAQRKNWVAKRIG